MYLLARARVQYDEAVEAWSTMIGKHGRRANGVRPGAQATLTHTSSHARTSEVRRSLSEAFLSVKDPSAVP